MHHQNVSWNQAFKFLNQASGTGAYHGTRHSYLATRLPVQEFSQKERMGKESSPVCQEHHNNLSGME